MDYLIRAKHDMLRKIFFDLKLNPNQQDKALKKEWISETKAMQKHHQRYMVHIYGKKDTKMKHRYGFVSNVIGVVDDFKTKKCIHIASGKKDFTFGNCHMPTRHINANSVTVGGQANLFHHSLNITGVKVTSVLNVCNPKKVARTVNQTLKAVTVFFSNPQVKALYDTSSSSEQIKAKIQQHKNEINQLEDELGHC